MAYRKFRADRLFTGRELLGNDHVLITEKDGRIKSIVAIAEAGSDIEELRGILTPGFINCHCHLELSHMKGMIPTATGLIDFVLKVVTQRDFPQEEIFLAMVSAENELLMNGVVAVGDICNNTDSIAAKKNGRLYYHNFIEVSGWNPAIADIRFEKSKSFYDEYAKVFEGKLNASSHSEAGLSMAPHAPYSVSDELWEKIQPYYNGLTTIHNQESAQENELFENGRGEFLRLYNLMKIENTGFVSTHKSSLQSCLSKLSPAKRVILVHNTFTSQNDLEYCINSFHGSDHQHALFFCLCPNANLYIENELPPVELFRKFNCNIVLGTDSLASNHQLSILKEAQTLSKHFPNIPLEEILQWCTSRGAAALGISEQFGSFSAGKKPGINLIESTFVDHLSENARVRKML
ncbi:MAG: amidohydrolase [Bacteroidetes bacterium]|nr:MAG: amidohydrolase [Bacteroidota bacterium]